MKRKAYFGIAVSVLCLFLAFRKTQFGELRNAFSQAEYLYLIPAAACTLTSFYIRAYRWKFLMKPLKNARTMSLFSSTMIGFMANNLLPARLGEFVRAYAVGKKEKVSKTASFATIVIERVLDVFVLLVLFGILILVMPLPKELKVGGYFALVLNAVSMLVLLAFLIFPRWTLSLATAASRPLPGKLEHRVSRIVRSFGQGLEVFKRGKETFYSLMLSFVVWFFAGLAIYFSILSVEVNLPPHATLLVLVVLSLGVMIPSSPAYVGPIQYFSVLGLSLFDVDKTRALAFSFLYHSTQFFPVTLLGLFYLWKENLSIREITAKDVVSFGNAQGAKNEKPGA
ncbi:MAG: lysylphosphatidylglycerol synthase transmembrane domain-containing protein [Candidatus Eisenbacteria bacterium]|nr:lysylphosphatidylglycerol synthase transmembrane domain-containing protein [Candidatus Eisenbacteria bacterium]